MSNPVCNLVPDRRGVAWDALLYLPTTVGLGVGAIIFWHQDNHNLAYLLFFLCCFFLFQGAHRILGRLMLLPASPVLIDVSKQRVLLQLRNSERVELVKDVRYFSDYADKSFGLTGMDLKGARKQYVFHRGQFHDDDLFKKINAALKTYS